MSKIRSDRGIYQLLERYLREAPYAMTCVNLMDITEVREEALKEYGGNDKDMRLATNKLSDLLGFMWRRGLLTRYPAQQEGNSLARWAYIWDKKEDARPAEPVPSPSSNGKTGARITELENGAVEIEFEKFSIVIKPK